MVYCKRRSASANRTATGGAHFGRQRTEIVEVNIILAEDFPLVEWRMRQSAFLAFPVFGGRRGCSIRIEDRAAPERDDDSTRAHVNEGRFRVRNIKFRVRGGTVYGRLVEWLVRLPDWYGR